MAMGDVYRVRTICYTATQIAINSTYWLSTNSTGAGALPADIATAFDTLFAPVYKNWMSSAAKWRGVDVQKQVTPRPVPEFQIVNDAAGNGSANMLPTQVSGVIGWKTLIAGRHNRGRIYPGFVDALFADAAGSLTAGGVAVLAPIAAAYGTQPVVTTVAPAGTDTFRLCVRSVTVAVPPPNLVAYTPVVTGIPRTRFATQRRRGQFGRTNVLPF